MITNNKNNDDEHDENDTNNIVVKILYMLHK